MGKTLDYDSVANWMSLAVWASKRYQEWKDSAPVTDLWTDDGIRTLFFHEIAVEALNRGFSLRVGDRAWAIVKLLQAIAPGDSNLVDAYYRIDKESWLTPVGAKKARH